MPIAEADSGGIGAMPIAQGASTTIWAVILSAGFSLWINMVYWSYLNSR